MTSRIRSSISEDTSRNNFISSINHQHQLTIKFSCVVCEHASVGRVVWDRLWDSGNRKPRQCWHVSTRCDSWGLFCDLPGIDTPDTPIPGQSGSSAPEYDSQCQRATLEITIMLHCQVYWARLFMVSRIMDRKGIFCWAELVTEATLEARGDREIGRSRTGIWMWSHNPHTETGQYYLCRSVTLFRGGLNLNNLSSW